MDFLESAAVLVPALTGLSMTVYNNDTDILDQFESQYCFSPQLQQIYTSRSEERRVGKECRL